MLFVIIGALIMLWMVGVFIDLGWVGIVGFVILGMSPFIIKFTWNKFVDFLKYYNNKRGSQ